MIPFAGVIQIKFGPYFSERRPVTRMTSAASGLLQVGRTECGLNEHRCHAIVTMNTLIQRYFSATQLHGIL